MENMLCYLSNAVKYSAGGKITISATLQDAERDVETKTGTIRRNSIHENLAFAVRGGRSSTVDVVEAYIDDSACASAVTKVLCISVEDEGIGISDQKKSSLFQPFQQTMRLAGGTGLGLYSLAKRVDALHGKYGVTDRSDGRPGSRFWFTVPYEPDVDYGPDFSPELSQEMRLGTMTVISRPTSHRLAWGIAEGDPVLSESSSLFALVVEDSLVISKATARMLSKAGYVVDAAENGAIGLEKMKKRVYSIVIMDLQMPIMDGLEATRRIRSFESEASYIASGEKKQLIFGVSANSEDEIREEALASGMNLFVLKPFSINHLLEYQAEEPRDFEDFSP
jgi:CheY-like chemotaxis protein